MRGMGSKPAIWAVISTVSVLATGGCPMVLETALPLGAEPGVYWVEDFDEGLRYFDLGRERGEAGRWLAIEDDGFSWYAGAGVHEFDSTNGWRRLDDATAAILDELIQLHDPAPSVPSSMP